MSAHQLERFLRDAHLPAAGKGLLIPGVGYMLGWGVTVPTDSVTTDNYAPGAWFFHTDGATDQTLIYINCGTRISNNFDPITSITLSDAGGLITATNVEDALQEAFQHSDPALEDLRAVVCCASLSQAFSQHLCVQTTGHLSCRGSG